MIVDKTNFSVKALAGDSWVFQEPDLGVYDFKNTHAVSPNELLKVNVLTPEVVEKILTKGVAGNETKFRKV